MPSKINGRSRRRLNSKLKLDSESSATAVAPSPSPSLAQSRRRRPQRRAAAVAASAALSTAAASSSAASNSLQSSSLLSNLTNKKSVKKTRQKHPTNSSCLASTLSSSASSTSANDSLGSCLTTATATSRKNKNLKRRQLKTGRGGCQDEPPVLTLVEDVANSLPSSTPMPQTRQPRPGYNLRSQRKPISPSRRRPSQQSTSPSPPCLEVCGEVVNADNSRSSQDNQQQDKQSLTHDSVAKDALLKAAIVVLSPLPPVAVLSNSIIRNSQESIATTNSSQQDMARKLKRVAKRRIEVDDGVAAAIANRPMDFSDADCDAIGQSHQSKRSWQSPNSSSCVFASATSGAVNAGAAAAFEDDERLLDQSLEQSYWRLYQDCEYRDCVLRLCRQTDCVRWEDAMTQEMLDGLHKVGEGVYGEVYATRRGRQEVALKLFPIEGGQLVNGEPQKMFNEVLPELLISRKLTNLAYRYRGNKTGNFVQLLNASIVRGRLHPRLSEAWEAFNTGIRVSDNENPEFLPARQQWLLLEYKFAGCPLPAFRFGCYREARSVILQLALSLAAAESQFQFEHRDLHWNNVLVRRSGRAKIRYRINEHNYAIDCQGLEVTIIDFTVSRVSPAPGYVLYIDMSGDEGIFVGDGDYQFEVYRMMRRDCSDDWRKFNPRSNLMWLHYLLDKLLTATAFPRRDPDSLAVQSELAALQDCLLGYSSCEQLVRENFYFLDNALDNDAAGLE